MWKKPSFHEATVAGIVSALITSVVIALVPEAREWFIRTIESVWSHLGESTLLSNCILYPLIGWSGLSAFLLILHIRERFFNKDQSMLYLQDQFRGVIWRWSYRRKKIIRIAAFCPRCDTQLLFKPSGSMSTPCTYLHCERCHDNLCVMEGNYSAVTDTIQRLIERNLRTGEWKNLIPKPSEFPKTS